MDKILKGFLTESLYDASLALFHHLNIKINKGSQHALRISDRCKFEISLQAKNAIAIANDTTYLVGVISSNSFVDENTPADLAQEIANAQADAHYKGMFVFAVNVDESVNLTRTICMNMTRLFNRFSPNAPVVLIIKHGQHISIATCERSAYVQSGNVGEKVGKVSILRNINCKKLHAGHRQILEKLGDDAKKCKTFDALFEKWQATFSVEVLTKKFYDALYHWYQWAVEPTTGVRYPNNPETPNDDRQDINVQIIRLITRLLFVWFIKQKELVPNDIFDVEVLKNDILVDFDEKSMDEGNYYNAILQNLFFATLNNEIGSLSFTKQAYHGTSSSYGVKTIFRDSNKATWFKKSKDEILRLFSTVPYMNCGLFECLDRLAKSDLEIEHDLLIDGFSSRDNTFTDPVNGKEHWQYRAFVPNGLFFAGKHRAKVWVEENKDENVTMKQVEVEVEGIIHLFNSYNFTVEENTPNDVDVSLDPELLGRVFENLLAAFNPETRENARKATGSFYTPRPIVGYMVNESLVQYLKTKVVGGEGLEEEFRKLISYQEEETNLLDVQKKDILHCLYTCKILDPACGSGAFPMGMLQQMVHIMKQLDPDNSIWHEVVLEEAERETMDALKNEKDKDAREKRLLEINEDFENDLTYPDYKRKLHLIKNCIYGVDIQPIAMMISKLRFFISLICEQEVDKDAPEKNYGINTLPNLETKFVAANSLIPAKIRSYKEGLFSDTHLAKLKDELLEIRMRHFVVKTQKSKMANRERDAKKRQEIKDYILFSAAKIDEALIEKNKALIAQYETELETVKGEDLVEESVPVQQNLFDTTPQMTIQIVDRNKRKRDELKSLISVCQREIKREESKRNLPEFEEAVKEVTRWNPYDQINASPFFDTEWMFGIKGGFDIYIGNPPYNGISQNNGESIRLLIEDYKKEPGTNVSLKERKLWLQDDYVKFIRQMESYIENSNFGILSFINNSSFIDNPTFRGMRWHLMNSFDEIYIIDLHGNARKNDVATSGEKDENVFNIMQGVSVNTCVKKKNRHQISTVLYTDIIGSREKKLKKLSNYTTDICYNNVERVAPFYLFKPQTLDGLVDYNNGFSIPDLMNVCVTGVLTARDGLVIDIDKDKLLKKISFFADMTKSDIEVRNHFFGKKKSPKYLPGDSRGWKLTDARKRIKDNCHKDIIIPIAFRVFDNRYIYYTPDMVDWGRDEIYNKHILNHENVCLVVPRQTTKEWRHVFVTDKVSNFNFLATGGQNGAGTHFPLYLYNDDSRIPNINNTIWKKVDANIGYHATEIQLFDYVYGILHSASYRKKYMEFLKGDFPKIPYPLDAKSFTHIAGIGERLRKLHLFNNVPDELTLAIYEGDGNNEVIKIQYKQNRLYINKNQFFDNVPSDVFEFMVGDDQPALRWLKERKNLVLSAEDICYYQQIIYVLSESKKIMEELQ